MTNKKYKYTILCGKMNDSGMGDLNVESTHSSLKEARKALKRVVQEERRTLKDWNLHKNQFVEIDLVKEPEDEDSDYDYIDLVVLR